jgi:hypothetical protein
MQSTASVLYIYTPKGSGYKTKNPAQGSFKHRFEGTYNIWFDLAVVNGAERVRVLKAEIERNKAEIRLQAAQQPPELGNDPAEFDWPPNTTPMVVLDVSPYLFSCGKTF